MIQKFVNMSRYLLINILLIKIKLHNIDTKIIVNK